MEKEKLKKLIAIGIITQQQASLYIQQSSHIPLKNWLIQHHYLNAQRWQQIFSEQQVLPQSFIFSPNAPSQSVDSQTREEIIKPVKQLNIEKERVFLHYEIQQKIGEGGMGKVYKARDSITNRLVALKFISASIITNEDRKRFLQEVRAISRLEHENIVKLYEVGEQPTLYYSMEYIEGKTLKGKIFRSFTHMQIADIFEQISRGLHYAHQKGIIHRDIKPDNILLTGKREVKITDFGLAKDNEIQSSISRTGNIVGTPAYLSPEQVQGVNIDQRADVYSVGATLYYILTQQLPFRDESFVSLFFDILHTIPTPPRRFNSEIPKNLQAICLKCLEKKPSLRYKDAEELATDLRNFIEKKPTIAQKNNLRMVSHQFRKLTGKKWLLLLLSLNIFLFSYTNKQNFKQVQVQVQEQVQIQEQKTHHSILLAELTSEDNHLHFLYNKGKLLYQKRQRDESFKEKAKGLLVEYIQKIKNKLEQEEKKFEKLSKKNKKIDKLKNQNKNLRYFIIHAEYKILHIDAIELITKGPTEKNTAEDLNHKSKTLKEKILADQEKSSQYQHILQQLQAFEKISHVLQSKTQKSLHSLTFSGYGNLFLAYKKNTTLNLTLKYLHEALRMIPFEEQVYLKLLEIYSKIEFYEEAVCLYNHLQKINPFLISPDILMVKMLIKQKKFDKLDHLFSKLKPYNDNLLLLRCEYFFLIKKNNQAQIILEEISKRKPGNFLKKAIENTKSLEVNDLIRISKFHTSRRKFYLAAKYIKQSELALKAQEKTLKYRNSRIHSIIQRARINLYRAKLQQNQIKFSLLEFNQAFSANYIAGFTERFITNLSIVYLFTENNINGDYVDKHMQHLQKVSGDYCFFTVSANYLFHQKKYLEAITYWGNAMRLQPIFNKHIKQKQLRAWKLYKKEKN